MAPLSRSSLPTIKKPGWSAVYTPTAIIMSRLQSTWCQSLQRKASFAFSDEITKHLPASSRDMHTSSPIKHIKVALLDGQPRVKATAELDNSVKVASEEQYDCDVEHGEDGDQLTPAARMRTPDKVQREVSTHTTAAKRVPHAKGKASKLLV